MELNSPPLTQHTGEYRELSDYAENNNNLGREYEPEKTLM